MSKLTTDFITDELLSDDMHFGDSLLKAFMEDFIVSSMNNGYYQSVLNTSFPKSKQIYSGGSVFIYDQIGEGELDIRLVDEVKKECNCSSRDLFNFGCRCGFCNDKTTI
jgi:hypothetical protein